MEAFKPCEHDLDIFEETPEDISHLPMLRYFVYRVCKDNIIIFSQNLENILTKGFAGYIGSHRGSQIRLESTKPWMNKRQFDNMVRICCEEFE